MADTQVGPINQRYVDTRRGRDTNNQKSSEQANLGSVSDMRARLTTLNGAYYTAARLNTMTVNDMVHALRQASDSAGIK